MDITIVRHTQTNVAKGICFGQTDIPLADSFVTDLASLQQKLPELSTICQVYSSPLSRCLQLAQALSPTVITDSRLLELNFGAWENQSFDDLSASAVKEWSENFVDRGPPDGESFRNLCLRVGDFWGELIQNDQKHVLIVTHAGVIRALLSLVLQLSPANAFQFKVDHGSLLKLRYVNNYTYVLGVNF